MEAGRSDTTSNVGRGVASASKGEPRYRFNFLVSPASVRLTSICDASDVECQFSELLSATKLTEVRRDYATAYLDVEVPSVGTPQWRQRSPFTHQLYALWGRGCSSILITDL